MKRFAFILALSTGTVLAQDAVSLAGQFDTQLNAEKRTILQAQIKTTRAEEAAFQSRIEELRNTSSDSAPNVIALRNKLNELRAQELVLEQSLAHFADERPPLKQTSGGPQVRLPDRWW